MWTDEQSREYLENLKRDTDKHFDAITQIRSQHQAVLTKIEQNEREQEILLQQIPLDIKAIEQKSDEIKVLSEEALVLIKLL